MKRFCLTVALLLSVCHLFAQAPVIPPSVPMDSLVRIPGVTLPQIEARMQALLTPADTGEGDGDDQFSQFSQFWSGHMFNTDSSGNSMFRQYYRAMSPYTSGRLSTCAGADSYQGNWQLLGPLSAPGQLQGKVDVVWADPSDSNFVLAGTIGGLFRSTDGGANWVCVTDGTPIIGGVIGIASIAVNPLNRNNILLGTSVPNGYFPGWAAGGCGILRSYDRGTTWQQVTVAHAGAYGDSIRAVQGVFFTPDSTRIYAFSNDSVFTRLNKDTAAWHNITPHVPRAYNDPATTWFNLQFVPGSPAHFFISSGGPDHQEASVYESHVAVPSPSDWARITAGFMDTLSGIIVHDTDFAIMDISAPSADTLYMAGCYIGNNRPAGLWKYNISGSTHKWTAIAKSLPSPTNPTWGHFHISVSPAATDSNGGNRVIYFGSDTPYMSFDGGHTFHLIGSYYGYTTHGDIRSVYIQSATNSKRGKGDRVYLATDGGVSKKPAGADVNSLGQLTTVNINGMGLACGDYNGLGTSEQGGMVVSGMWHDGVATYEPTLTPAWFNISGFDAYTSIFDEHDPKTAYFWAGFPSTEINNTEPSAGRDLGGSSFVDGQPEAGNHVMAADNFGNIYTGQSNLFVKTRYSSTLAEATGLGFPAPILGNLVLGIAISPYDSNFNGYLLYNPAYQSSGDVQNFYYRNPQNTPPVSVITHIPGAPDYYPMTCVTTDPHNTQRVWVGQGGINYDAGTQSFDRVQYSPNHGQYWVDISNGLPNKVPVVQIVYQAGANILYCATEVGIYRCDLNTFDSTVNTGTAPNYHNNSVQWTCFNQGAPGQHNFPNCFVTQLAINYCSGKLYASTQGRSIWATDLAPQSTIINVSDSIKKDSTITADQFLYGGGMVVVPGKTLTIKNCTMHMPKNGRIVVQPGAKLVVTGATLTNDCQQCMWKGIEARGNSTLAQTAANQATVIIENGSVIENALNAVSNWDLTDSNFTTTGGIIQASNSSFLNNKNSISFGPYHNYHSTFLWPNLSYVSECTFNIDSFYRGDDINLPFQDHIGLWEVEGVRIAACTFNNKDNSAINSGAGTGILAWNAGFTVLPDCGALTGSCPSPTRSRFTGMGSGINVQGDLSVQPTISIDRADFDSISIGIYVSGINNVSTTRCNFDVGHGRDVANLSINTQIPCHQNIGLYIQNNQQYVVEGNSFTGHMPSGISNWHNMGAVISNTGGHSNNIYRNTFTTLTEAIDAMGHNKGDVSTLDVFNGLRVICNTFSNNISDIYVASDGGTSPQGIAISQQNGHAPCGNTFSGSNTNINNNASSIDYYCHSGTSSETPSTTVNTFLYCDALNADNCGSTLGGGSSVDPTLLSTSALATTETTFTSFARQYHDSLNYYNSHMDFGNTTTLLGTIDAATNATTLYNTLMSGTPFLSDTVLREVSKKGLNSEQQYMNILLACPDNLRSGDFISYIQNHGHITLTPTDYNTLSAHAGTLTHVGILQSNIAASEMLRSQNANHIMTAIKACMNPAISPQDSTQSTICRDSNNVYYRLDSNSFYYRIDSTPNWLQTIGDLWTYYSRLGYYNFKHSYTQGTPTFNSITANYTLPGVYGQELTAYRALWADITEAQQAGRFSLLLNSTEISAINAVAVDPPSPNSAAVIAGGITGMLLPGWGTEVPYLYCILDPHDMIVGARMAQNTKEPETSPIDPVTNVRLGCTFSAYPNPAKTIVIFNYGLPQSTTGLHLTISNMLGQKVAEYTIVGNSGQQYWNVDLMPSGFYIYEFRDDDGIIANGKILVTK